MYNIDQSFISLANFIELSFELSLGMAAGF